MNKLAKIITLFLMTVIAITAATATYFNIAYANKIFPNITINGKNYSGLTKEQALNKLKNEIKNKYKDGISFSYKGRIYQAETEKIGLEIDTNKTIDNAFSYGHRKNLFQSLKEQLFLIRNKSDFKLDFKLNEEKLENYITEKMQEIEIHPKNFSYKYDKEKFIPIPAQSGMLIDRDEIKDGIANNILEFENNKIEIKLVKKEPEIKSDQNNNASRQAYNLINKKITLKYNSDTWEVQKSDVALWIKFDAIDNPKNKDNKIIGIKADKEKIEDYLVSLVPQINREPINAQLEFKNGKVSVFSLDQEGITLQIEKSAGRIIKSVFTSENYESALAKDIEVELATKKIKPEITIEDINNMGITALLSTGESNFYGSPKNRKHNIAVGAGKFHGVLIGPGDEFSFNKILGKVGPKEGYLPELVIKKGETIPEYGGGLCQVSTTAFRAAVKAGLEITERKNHAYPVKYYNPQGTDATIYPPHPDLRFKNNTPAYILIQTRVEGNKLYFDFYGSDDGRKVKLKGPYTYDRKPDGSMKATWTQEVYDKNNKLIFKKTFYSSYKSPSLYPHKNPLE
jgi:vancomycin resistance protein YoaR